VAIAFYTQRAYRIRKDDGGETGATWYAALNTDSSVPQATTARIRIEILNSVSPGILTPQLEYNKNGAGWNAVTTSSSNIKAVASAFVTNDTATTNQFSGAGVFTAGDFSSDGLGTTWTASLDTHTEFEFSFQIVTTDTTIGDTIQLRITNVGTQLNLYSQTPTLTVSAASGGGGSISPGSLVLLGVGK
jgi:hypothetical protein